MPTGNPHRALAHQHTGLRTGPATPSTMMSSPSQLRDCETPELDMPDFAIQNAGFCTTPVPLRSHRARATATQGHYPPRALARLARSLQDPAGRPRRYGSSGAPTFPPTATTGVTQPELRPRIAIDHRVASGRRTHRLPCAQATARAAAHHCASFSPLALGRTARRALPKTEFSQAAGTLRPRVVGVLPAPMPSLRYPWLPRYRRPAVPACWASKPVNRTIRRHDRSACQWESQQGRAWWQDRGF